ncbi:MAG: hypothetical protein CVT94_02795 [Bacteroidetes bacterium HGW-Bacteroidetes-11]|jgi:hypothetical protein|nr:MAG: hypothetical protein CVT94_02795 [Bacteroidetes bacterium HGW-Bacteroidetes-11]
MKYLPVRKFKISIPYHPAQFEEKIIVELLRNKDNEKSFFKTSKLTFNGEIVSRNFKLHRRGFGNTSMIPIIKGKILDTVDDRSSIIEIKINYSPLTNIFLGFWFGFVTVVFLLSIIHAVINWKFNIGIPLSLGMFLIAYGMTMLTFSEEVKTIKRYFYEKWFIKFD